MEQRWANRGLWTKSGPLPVFANKALLEHNCVHVCVCWPWPTTMVSWSSCDSDSTAHTGKTSSSLTRCRKSLLSLGRQDRIGVLEAFNSLVTLGKSDLAATDVCIFELRVTGPFRRVFGMQST